MPAAGQPDGSSSITYDRGDENTQKYVFPVAACLLVFSCTRYLVAPAATLPFISQVSGGFADT